MKEVMREDAGGSPIRGGGISKEADASEERRNGKKTGEERLATKQRGRERGQQEPGNTEARRRYHSSEDMEGSDQWWKGGYLFLRIYMHPTMSDKSQLSLSLAPRRGGAICT